MGKATAFVDKTSPIAGVVDIRQPQHDRTQSALTLSDTMAGDPLTRGRRRCHALHVTLQLGAFKPFDHN